VKCLFYATAGKSWSCSFRASLRSSVLANSRFRNYRNNFRNIKNLKWIIYPMRKGAANSKRMTVSFVFIWSHKTATLAPHFSIHLLDLYKQWCSRSPLVRNFVRFISREITQATSSLVSRLETRFSILEILETRLETRFSKFSRIENRVSRREDRDARDCQLTFDRYCTTELLILVTLGSQLHSSSIDSERAMKGSLRMSVTFH